LKPTLIDGLDEYLAQPNLQNKRNCERDIDQVLSTKKGKPTEETTEISAADEAPESLPPLT
jgi:hypothetical protein